MGVIVTKYKIIDINYNDRFILWFDTTKGSVMKARSQHC